MTFRELINLVLTEHGFDVTEPTVKSWLNERYATMVVRAQWRLAERSLGSTSAGESDVPVDTDVQDLAFITVDGSDPWTLAGSREMRQLQNGTAQLVDAVGAFARAFDADGNAFIRLSPTPDTSGLDVLGHLSLPPLPMVADDEVPIVPADFHRGIGYGAIAVGLELDAETLQSAQYFNGIYEADVERLRKRANSRIGSGPTRMRLGR